MKLVIWKMDMDRLGHRNQAKLIPIKNNSNDCSIIGSDIPINDKIMNTLINGNFKMVAMGLQCVRDT